MSETSATQKSQLSLVQQTDSTSDFFIVPVELSLSAEDKLILYAAFQAAAKELRRIKRERSKTSQTQNNTIVSEAADAACLRVSQRY
jgi:hypothetical protein